MVIIMKVKNIIFMIASTIIFVTLSFNSFVLANGNYSGDFLLVYSLASFLILISLLGMIFPKKIYNIFWVIGSKLLSTSVYYADMLVEKKQGYKSFNFACKVFAVISNSLLVILVVLLILGLV